MRGRARLCSESSDRRTIVIVALDDGMKRYQYKLLNYDALVKAGRDTPITT